MATTYYQSDLTKEQIEQALHAVNGVASSQNNGKVLYIDENGEIKAKSAAEWQMHLVPKTITQNGSYDPASDSADGYNGVSVNVPNSYAAADEGKVVSNGALVAQTARTPSITENGTYDTTGNNSVTVNVPPGSAPVLQPKSVTENGDYYPPTGVDGFSEFHVNVQGGGGGGVVQPLNVTANGTYNPPSGVDGYAPVVVNVPGGNIPVILQADWDAMTTAQKQAYGLVAIQNAVSGYLRGSLVNGADYIPAPMIIYAGSQNVSVPQSLSYTFDAYGTYQIIVTCVSGDTDIKQSFSIQHNGVELQHTFTYPSTNNVAKINLCVLEIEASTGDVISVSNTQNWSNSGMHLIILENCDTSKVGLYNSAGNNNTSFSIDTASWYLQVAKYGYYGSNNTVPTFEIDNVVKQSTPTPNEGRYWYGGTYVLTLT